MDWHHFERLLHSKTPADVWREAAKFAGIHGFDRYSFIRNAVESSRGLPPFLLSHSYDGPFWKSRFEQLEQGEGLRSDPIVMHVLAGEPPTAWNWRGDVAATRHEILPRAHHAASRA